MRITIFSSNPTLEFISNELLNSRSIPKEERTADPGLRILKAYVWYLAKYSDKFHHIVSNEDIPDKYENLFFQWAAWPPLLDQYEFKVEISDTYRIQKIGLTLEYLRKNGYSSYCDQYIEFKGVDREEEIIRKMLVVNQVKSGDNISNFFINIGKSDSLMDSLAINLDDYRDSLSKQNNFIGIREKPLCKINDGQYLVMSWGFFENTFDISYLFDFYYNSGIKSVLKDFLSFKKLIGDEVLEKIFFQRVINFIFHKKHIKILFDDNKKISHPDAYVRDGNNVYLFEFKDAFMPSSVSSSYDADKIKQDVDEKFFENKKGKRKGVKQLSNAVQSIIKGEWINDTYLIGKQRKNIKIYPVIIYSHVLYSTPGINNYLSILFDEEMAKFSKSSSQKIRVNKLVTISLSFLTESAIYFSKVPNSMREMIRQYNDKIHSRRKTSIRKITNKINKKDRINIEFSENKSLQDEYKDFVSNWYATSIPRKVLEKNLIDLFHKVGPDSLSN